MSILWEIERWNNSTIIIVLSLLVTILVLAITYNYESKNHHSQELVKYVKINQVSREFHQKEIVSTYYTISYMQLKDKKLYMRCYNGTIYVDSIILEDREKFFSNLKEFLDVIYTNR